MSKPTDLRVKALHLEFSDETLAVPLQLSRGMITTSTYARVTIQGETRRGCTVSGEGAILLSDLWAFPCPQLEQAQKAQIMRRICKEIAHYLPSATFGDPIELGHDLEQQLPSIGKAVEQVFALPGNISIPLLALLNCMSPFDAAIHDAWGKAIGNNVYLCYTPEYLNADLGVYLGSAFNGQFPANFLGNGRKNLIVQHVVGLSDALTPSEWHSPQAANGEVPSSLASWIERDRVFVFKVKASGTNPNDDALRLANVFAVATKQLAETGVTTPLHLSCDPNEGYEDVEGIVELLGRLERDHPHVYAALDYIEQPTPRDLDRYTYTLTAASRHKPIIMDESLDRLSQLPLLKPLGWSGLAVKTCKGHTHSLLAYCWAKRNNLYVSIQDLTNPGLALVHSANLAAHLCLSNNYFECNSRQYLPLARSGERLQYPEYFSVQKGTVQLPEWVGSGLYGAAKL